MATFNSGPKTLTLPRILCLHGGGVSAEIFFYQCRSLINALSPHFRLVFCDGPFFCPMHPDLVPVYSDMGPTYRWTPWLPDHVKQDTNGNGGAVDNESAVEMIEDSMRTAMDRDEGVGEWVGLLGFSQGANITASVLFENQFRHAALSSSSSSSSATESTSTATPQFSGFAGADWKFGALLAGRAPPKSLSSLTSDNKFFGKAGELGDLNMLTSDCDVKLEVPTLHLHGLRDPGLELHRDLLNDYCRREKSVLVEWDEGHRVPIKPVDVKRFVDGLFKVVKAAGVPLVKDVDQATL